LTVGVVRSQTESSFLDKTIDGLAIRQADFIQNAGLGNARVLNAFDSSPYLEWRLNGRPAMFVDHLNAYPMPVFNDWYSMWSASPAGLSLLDRDGIDCVIGERITTPYEEAPLYGYLFNSPQWREVYDGADGPIFIRAANAPPPAAPIN
jgi:hypothetical protein